MYFISLCDIAAANVVIVVAVANVMIGYISFLYLQKPMSR